MALEVEDQIEAAAPDVSQEGQEGERALRPAVEQDLVERGVILK